MAPTIGSAAIPPNAATRTALSPHRRARAASPGGDGVPEAAAFPVWLDAPLQDETPALIRYGCREHAVMMITPTDLRDFAVGFTISEGLATDRVLFVGARKTARGLVLDLELPPAAQAALPEARTLEGRSGCGVCGVRALDDLRLDRLPRVNGATAARAPITPAALAMAVAALPRAQTQANARGGLLHAAARVATDGGLLAVREDIGRHNALDKTIGSAIGTPAAGQGFLLVSSRCSFELVVKSLRAGYVALATLAGPTALAVDLARQSGLFLVCRTGSVFRRFA